MFTQTTGAPSGAAHALEPTEGPLLFEELQLAFRNRGMPLEAMRYDVTATGLHYLVAHWSIFGRWRHGELHGWSGSASNACSAHMPARLRAAGQGFADSHLAQPAQNPPEIAPDPMKRFPPFGDCKRTVASPTASSPELRETTCCVVGAGPAGVMLSLLLARAGIRVTLLEAHRDFERDFRGDTIHPSTLEVLDQIGLAERLHELPHVKAPAFRTVTPAGTFTGLAFNRLPTPFPYMMIMPQSRFLEFLVGEAKKSPPFEIVMGARVQHLIEEDGVVRGVAYPTNGSRCQVRAPLTVATDGRFSRIRKLAQLEAISQSGPMEVIWLRLPRRPEDHPEEATIYLGLRQAVVALGRTDEWQLGVVLPKGGYRRFRDEGLDALQDALAATVPWLGDRVRLLDDWQRVNLLSVEADRLPRWHRPGLLLLGDAAHVMLPVAGVGINCAIADAVEATNVLVEPLRSGRVEESQLAEVQKRRERMTRLVQRFQAAQRDRVIRTLESGTTMRVPRPVRVMLRVPGLRTIPARVTAFGGKRVRLQDPQGTPSS